MRKALVFLFILFLPLSAHAATCDAGYWNDNGTCTICPAGYACSGGVKTNCADHNGPNGRPTFTTYAGGASECTECPEVTSDLAARLTDYGYYPYYSRIAGIDNCTAYFSDTDPDATFSLTCYYKNGAYGSVGATCHAYPPTSCAAGKYNTIDLNAEWQDWGATQHTTGIDSMNGKVCTDVGHGYYSPTDSVSRTKCPIGTYTETDTASSETDCLSCTNLPQHAHYTDADTTGIDNCPWVCDDGYYLENNACVGCGQDGYYCPGDNIKHQCPTESNEILYSGVPGSVTSIQYVSWGCSLNSNSPNCCIVRGYGADDRGEYLWSRQYNNDSYSHNLAILWSVAYNGYYLSDCVSYTSDYYSNIYACTNAPLNTHYVGPGTHDVGNCPWQCDVGYGRTKNDTCEPLCGAGITQLRTSNGLSYNLYANKTTTPSINIKPDNTNTVCYVNLAIGNATNTINVQYGNTVYHTTN